MKKAKTKIPQDSENIIDLRKRSKRGERLSKEEHELCRVAWEKYPEWYKETEERVFNETVPFGSNVRYKKG